MRIVSVLFVVLFAVSVLVQLLTWRRQRRVRPIFIAVSQVAALASSVTFSALIHRPPAADAWIILLAVGMLFGVVYGSSMVVDRGQRGVVMNYSLASILTWSALMMITQLTTIFSRSVPIVIYSLAIVNLGVNLGMNGNVLPRYRALRGAATIALLALLALAALPAHPTSGQSGDSSQFAGTYDGSVLFPFGNVIAFDFTLVVDELGEVAGIGEEHSAGIPMEGPAPGGTGGSVIWAYKAVDLSLSCSGSIDGQGKLTCVGNFTHSTTLTDPADGTAFDGEDHSGPFTIELTIAASGSAEGTFVSDYGTARCSATATSGGPAQVPGTSAPEPTTVAPADTAVAATPATSSEATPPTSEPLTDERTLIAVAIANLLLAGGSLAQLLPLLQRGMSLHDAVSVLTGAADRLPSSDLLAGMPRTDSGRVLFQAPWEEGGPMPMDPEEVRGILELQRQGYHYSRGYGWTTPEAGDAMRARDDILWRRTVADHSLIDRIVDSQRTLDRLRTAEARTAADITRVGVLIDESVARIDEQLANMSGEAMAARVLQDAEHAAVGGVGLAADAVIGTISWSAGPAGHAIRLGYDYVKGAATVLGEKWASGGDVSFSAADVRRANNLGVTNLVSDYGTDLTLQGAGRVIQTYRGVPLKPLTQVFDEQFVTGVTPKVTIPEELVPVRSALDQLVNAGDDIARIDPEKALELYKNGGMKDLAHLEAAGGLTRAEADALNDALKGVVDDAAERALPVTTELFHAGNPMVGVKEVLIGDAGSSARRAARSVLTDADRTVVGVFDGDDVARHAATRGITRSEAIAELNGQLTQIYKKQVDAALATHGLTGNDVGLEAYSGYGGTGPVDSYPSGFAETTQATGGRAIAYRPGGQVHAVAGEAVVDQWRLGVHDAGAPATLGNPKIPVTEYAGIAEQQVIAAEKAVQMADVKTAAKALDRLGYVAERTSARGGPGIDRSLLDLARSIRRDPQAMNEILSRSGLSDEQFAAMVLEQTRQYHEAIGR